MNKLYQILYFEDRVFFHFYHLAIVADTLECSHDTLMVYHMKGEFSWSTQKN